jgi:site-specific recombinase XerD
MLSHDKQTQRTFAQADYISIPAETSLTAKKAEGRSTASLSFYPEKLNIFMAFCEAQAVTRAQDITTDFLRHYLLAMAEPHNLGGVHAIYRGVCAFLRFVEFEEVIPGWQSPTKRVKVPRVEIQPIESVSLTERTCKTFPVDRL